MNRGIGHWLARRAEITAGRTALVHGDRAWTYADWNADVQRVRHALRRRGVNPGDRVAVLTLNEPEFLTVAFACWQSGIIFVPLNFRLTGRELAFIIADAGVHTLVCGAEFVATIDGIRADVPVRHYVSLAPAAGWTPWADLVRDEPAAGWSQAIDDGAVAIIMYTSGTTGLPKGAMLTHGNVLWNNINTLHTMTTGADDRTLVCAPLFHIGGLNVTTLSTLQVGGTVVLMKSFDAQAVLDYIERHRITTMFGVPAMFLFMSQVSGFERRDLTSIRYFVCGGAPVPEALIRLYASRGVPFVQGYGLTETAPFALLLPKEDAARRIGSAGLPPMYTDVRIVDLGNRTVPPGTPGEIVIRGPNVMKGYWNRPEATAEAIDAEGWFHSGDIGVVDADGYHYVVDRKKDMIISGGENVYPAEVEAVLYEMPGIADVGVIGLPDPKWGERVVAVIVAAPGASVTAADVTAFASDKLARYKMPSQIEFVDELPRNPQGKVLKRVLRERFAKSGG
jgi:fatty-acyl-CoA synthase